jgi:microcompartment protein CcmK/EutM
VLVVQEGQAAAQMLHRKDVPVHSIVVAVVDGIDLPG